MNGFKVFKYYTAIRLHFTDSKFNVFVNKGHLRGSVDKFNSRNDRFLFEKVARMHPTDKECIQFIAANFMYDNPEVVYELPTAEANYKEYVRRRQSMTRVFTEDLHTIATSGARYDQGEFSGQKIPDVVQLYLARRITLETMVILDSMDSIVSKMRRGNHISLLLGDDLRRVEKSAGFVKYDSYKVMGPYQNFLEDIQGSTNGQDLPSLAEQI